jgi:hypothetical protein
MRIAAFRLQISRFCLKHRWVRWLQAIVLIPATWGIGITSFFLSLEGLVATGESIFKSEPFRAKLVDLRGPLFLAAATVGIVIGLISSWYFVVLGASRIKAKPSLCRKVRIGLLLGIIAACAALIWALKLPMGPYDTKANERFLLTMYMLQFDPPLALAIIQFYLLGGPESQESSQYEPG